MGCAISIVASRAKPYMASFKTVLCARTEITEEIDVAISGGASHIARLKLGRNNLSLARDRSTLRTVTCSRDLQNWAPPKGSSGRAWLGHCNGNHESPALSASMTIPAAPSSRCALAVSRVRETKKAPLHQQGQMVTDAADSNVTQTGSDQRATLATSRLAAAPVPRFGTP